MFTQMTAKFPIRVLAIVLMAMGSFSCSAQDVPAQPPPEQESAAQDATDQPDPAAEIAAQQNPAEQQQAAIDLLVAQLDQLIPGDYESDSVQYDKLFDIASFFANGNEAMVRAKITELAELDARLPPPDLLLAGMAFATNNPVQGKALLERAGTNHRNHPGIALAFAQLAIVQDRLFDALALVEKARTQSDEPGQDETTKQFYETAILKALTVIETRRKDFRRAREHASQWEKLEPAGNDMLLATAEIEFLLENSDSAQAYLNRRAEEQLATIPTELILAKWYRGINDLENYARWVESAQQKYTSNALTQIEYGTWLIFSEQFDRAAEIVAQYESENGESAESKLIRGRIAFSKEDFAAAEELFGDLHRQQPNDFENSYLYALCLLGSDDPEKHQQAGAIVQRNLQVNPNNQLALASMGWALLRIGKPDLAQQLLSRIPTGGNILPDTAFFLAKLMVEQDRRTQARNVLEPFLETKQTFLFRPAAKRLIEQIDSEKDAELPNPGDGG